MRWSNGLKIHFRLALGASDMSTRQPYEAFAWHSATPRWHGAKPLLITALCTVCGAAGYMAGQANLEPSTGSLRQSPRIDRATRVPLHRLKVIWIKPHGKQVPPHTPYPQPCRKLPKPTPLVLCCSIQTPPTGNGRVSVSLNGLAQPQARNG